VTHLGQLNATDEAMEATVSDAQAHHGLEIGFGLLIGALGTQAALLQGWTHSGMGS
jgi:hypothetical protein